MIRKIRYLSKIQPLARGVSQPVSCVCWLVLITLVSPLCQAQILNNGGLIEPITRPIENIVRPVERQVDELGDKAEQIASDTGISQTLSGLPLQLPIIDLNGNTAFIDEEVEDGWRAVQNQWLVMLEPGELAVLQALNIEIIEQTFYDDLGLSLLRFQVDEALDSRDALLQVLPADLVERFDRNHIYQPQNQENQKATQENLSNFSCPAAIKIGMVDTSIQQSHPAFKNSAIVEKSFLEQTFESPNAHGTAVAGLLIGELETLPSRLPKASLFNASVFYTRDQYAQGATMMHLLAGLNWLMSQQVQLINLSLAGPDNRILKSVIDKVVAKGSIVVAAAGNAGPASPPLFPAAYEKVISATAVDSKQKIYRWANQGTHIDFAALGVSITTARSDGSFGRESGTSMAAPLVTSFIACELANGGTQEEIIERLATKALDLGTQGRDSVFGFGLLR